MTTDPHTLNAWLDEIGTTDILRLDPAEEFDQFVLGYVEQFNNTFLLYDRARLINHLVEGGLTIDEAEEHFDFNIRGAWVGSSTPGFFTPLPTTTETETPT